MDASILDSQGRTIACSTASSQDEFQQFNSSAVIAALNGEESFLPRSRITNALGMEKTVMSYSYPCKDESGKVEYIVYVQMDSQAIEDSIAQTARSLIVAVVIALIITAVQTPLPRP